MPTPSTAEPDLAWDLLQGFRDRNVMILGWAAIPFLLPFAIYSFFVGRLVVGALVALVAAIAIANAIGIWRHKRPWVPIWVMYAVVLAALDYALLVMGISASYWCYPGCFSVLFLAERREARILIVLSLAVLVPTAFLALPLGVATRFAVTLVMVSYFSDLVVGIFTQLQAQLTHLAVRDPLTGALNRRQMTDYLEAAVEESGRGMGAPSIVSLDLDHFKEINDTYGHETGDQALQRLVQVTKARARRLDAVFRMGGEEFVVLLRNTPLENAVTFAESLRGCIEDAALVSQRPVTVSLGVAQYQAGESIDDWLQRADSALYQAKRGGRNQVYPRPVSRAA